MKRALSLILLILITTSLFSQENSTIQKQRIFERITESLSEELSEESDLSSLLDDLERYSQSPLNLNTASRLELEKLQFLSAFQIENLLTYREKFGQVFSIAELQAIEGFSAETAENLSLFVSIIPIGQEPPSSFRHELNFRIQQNIEEQEGFQPDEEGNVDYQGIEPKLMMRYRAEKGTKYEFGFTAENDAGEDFFNNSNRYGFDFYSGYAGYHGNKLVKELYVGDYQLKMGQGLIQWTGFGGRKSSDVTKIRMTGQGLRASTSADENNFMRGISTTLGLKQFALTTFYSSHRVDGNIIGQDSTGKATLVSSLQTSGYHRTEGELFDENALQIMKTGASLNYTFDRFSAALNGVYQQFDAMLSPDIQPYNQFYFRGENNYNISTNFLWVQNNINLFGEAAMSKSKGKAIVLGAETQPAKQVAISILYRNFAKDFHSISGSSFAESSGNMNEQGIYTGITILPLPRTKFSAYVDNYASHWMKYTSITPVKGTDVFVQADYAPSRKLEMYLRFKTETNSEKISATMPIKTDEVQSTNRLRFNINWQPTELIGLQFRTEWSGYEKTDSIENGFLVFTGISGNIPNGKLAGNIRVAWFNTDSYNTRIYAYENDVPLSFYIPAYSGKGFRFYTQLKIEIIEKLTAYLKYAITNYTQDVTTIGTGSSLIEGNQKSELKIHLKYRF